MSVAWQDLSIGFPLVREIPAALSVAPGRRLPEAAHGGFTSATRRPSYDAPNSGNVHGIIKGIGLVNWVYVNPETEQFWLVDYRLFAP